MSEQPNEQATAPAALPSVPTETVTLDTPLQRGSKAVTEVSVRKPLSGALRGVALVDLLNMDTHSLTRVLPRITEPALTEAELRKMDPADLVQLGSKVSRFLLGKRAQEDETA
ncbi:MULTISPECIES: phage tail assembly protein [Halomonas]|uniref:phage tail assembly protein n=1 Tax=Halomonas TaxID=2745 RepID=UPI000E5A124B|nr:MULTISPECIES: phage tail assembly protein [Halomonas]AXY41077.1 phage tail assembly protein [Halomonas sp. JS92-SW72]